MYCDLFALPLCQQVDWEFWKSSAKQLEDDHPTVAHNLTLDQLRFIKERKGEGPLQQIRSNHKDLLVKLVSEIRLRGYAYRTEQTYEQWVCRFILFAKNKSPYEAGADEVKDFLNYLCVERHVSASTQNQALNALVFLFSKVLEKPIGELDNLVRAKKPASCIKQKGS